MIKPTPRGNAAIEAGKRTIVGLEEKLDEVLGNDGHRTLRKLLVKLLREADQHDGA